MRCASARRRMLQYALGVETVLLVALFAFYACITRQAAQQGLECDEVGTQFLFGNGPSAVLWCIKGIVYMHCPLRRSWKSMLSLYYLLVICSASCFVGSKQFCRIGCIHARGGF